jgi:hypothetical protein
MFYSLGSIISSFIQQLQNEIIMTDLGADIRPHNPHFAFPNPQLNDSEIRNRYSSSSRSVRKRYHNVMATSAPTIKI